MYLVEKSRDTRSHIAFPPDLTVGSASGHLTVVKMSETYGKSSNTHNDLIVICKLRLWVIFWRSLRDVSEILVEKSG